MRVFELLSWRIGQILLGLQSVYKAMGRPSFGPQ
ncbi:unnamed protein product [Linum tenue]|uniref:Uncharacterized protein n=1 Tax=Linum tenue TaxID=586396 RepID=A0AAV0PC83_9ROSI|nr:unnamed protein product [Linum tenue]